MELEDSLLCSQEPVISVLGYMNPFHTIDFVNIFVPSAPLFFNLLIPVRFTDKSFIGFLISLMCSAFPVHLISFYLITLKIFIESLTRGLNTFYVLRSVLIRSYEVIVFKRRRCLEVESKCGSVCRV